MKTLKLGRKKAHRTSLVRNLAVSLILHERITTTQSKAKLVQRYVERIINRVKKENDLNGYRVALSMLGGAQKPAKSGRSNEEKFLCHSFWIYKNYKDHRSSRR